MLSRARVAWMLSLSLVLGGGALAGCGSAAQAPADDGTADAEVAVEQADAAVADGTYQIEATTDSSMFHAESCTLTVEDGVYSVALSLPGEGFSRLYFGSAEDAATSDDEQIYDYYLNDDGKYTFDLPVEALDEELPIAAFGQRRDTWYDHVIVFHAPDEA